MDKHLELLPSDVTPYVSFFDRMSSATSRIVGRAWFFVFNVILVAIWGPTYWLYENKDAWQLVINTITTILTYLLVALLQNTQSRDNKAIQHKLNGISEALADYLESTANIEDVNNLAKDVRELRLAVGLENKESS